VALERRVEAELALGRHSELIPELEALVVSEPLRERFRAQLMLALYRSDRQTEALDAYRAARETLVDELGLEPAPALRELEHAILAQDPSLELSIPAQEARPLLAVPTGDLTLLTVASAIATGGSSELIVARLVSDESEVGPAAVELADATPAGTRVAAFTTDDPAADTVRLATAYDVELVLLDAPPSLDSSHVPGRLAAIFDRSPADVAVLTAPVGARGEGIYWPFGGGEHDWAALELGARLALSMAVPLRLVGTTAVPATGRRDASRLLADASIALKRVVGVTASPVLVGPHVLSAAVAAATAVVV